jgi:LPXTG-motif cell wall-anchored protein
VLALVLALPAAALAQSAGDNQYQDPFEDQGGGGQTQQQGSSQGDGGQQQAQAPSTQGQAADPSASTAQAEPGQTGTLPRTGSETTPLLLAYGLTLLLGGTALRRAARHTS